MLLRTSPGRDQIPTLNRGIQLNLKKLDLFNYTLDKSRGLAKWPCFNSTTAARHVTIDCGCEKCSGTSYHYTTSAEGGGGGGSTPTHTPSRAALGNNMCCKQKWCPQPPPVLCTPTPSRSVHPNPLPFCAPQPPPVLCTPTPSRSVHPHPLPFCAPQVKCTYIERQCIVWALASSSSSGPSIVNLQQLHHDLWSLWQCNRCKYTWIGCQSKQYGAAVHDMDTTWTMARLGCHSCVWGGTNLPFKSIDNELQSRRINTLDAFLNHVVSILVFDTSQNMPAEFADQQLLQNNN